MDLQKTTPHIRYFTPATVLQGCIKKYYLMEGDFGEKTQDVFYADGCPEIVFNLGVEFYRGGEKEHWAKVIGQIMEPLPVSARGKGKSFGIWFYPHGLSMISGIPARELTGKALALDGLFCPEFIDMVGDCLAHNQLDALIWHVNRFFTERLALAWPNPRRVLAERALTKMQHSATLSLAHLAELCQVSTRYLEKVFLETVGIRPKQFQRVLRFQRTLAHLHTQPSSKLTEIAYEKGFSDQSHFIKEFKAFTGLPPSHYRPNNHPINQFFLNAC